jgi:cytochrome c oxidase subunit 2
MTEWLGLPVLASAHGGQIDNLIGWTHVFMLILFVGWGGFFAYTLVRFRRSRHPVANYRGSGRTRRAFEGAGGRASFWSASRSRSGRCGRTLPERSAGRTSPEQFGTSHAGRTDLRDDMLLDAQTNPLGIDRSDPAAKDDVTTLNQLYLPANKPIIVKLRSKDVIHSFGVPEFRVKQDAIPGLTIPIWFIPDITTEEMRARTGNPEFQYEIACAQLCGLGHYRMRGFVTVQSPEEFQKWMEEQAKAQGQSAVWK